MESIEFQKPETVDEAVKLLQGADGNARILAGGTDLLVQLRAHMIDPSVIVDIKSIDETRELKKNADGSYTIGAAVAGAEAHEREDITADWPGVIEAWDLKFNLGNVVKYISRAGKKMDIVEDLRKAHWYLSREIKKLEENEQTIR